MDMIVWLMGGWGWMVGLGWIMDIILDAVPEGWIFSRPPQTNIDLLRPAFTNTSL
jgi:hypothetical protein